MLRLWLRWFYGEWRQHKGLMLWLLIGLINAAALLSAIELLNKAAQRSFAEAAEQTTTSYPWRVQSANSGHQIPYSLFLSLRRAGIDAQPQLEGKALLANGNSLRLQNHGLTPIHEQGVWVLLMDPELARERGWRQGQQIALANGMKLPPIKFVNHLGPFAVLDMALLAEALESMENLTYLQLPVLREEQQRWLETQLSDDLSVISEQSDSQMELIKALNLNLTALSVLAFLVALLLAFHAFERLLAKRQQAFVIMARLGVTPRQYHSLLLLEWSILAVLGGLFGSVLGGQLAQGLAPDLNKTLVSLYGLKSGMDVGWQWQQALSICLLLWVAMLLMTLLLKLRARQSHSARWWWLNAAAVLFTLILWRFSSTGGQALLVCALTVLCLLLLAPHAVRFWQKTLARWATHQLQRRDWQQHNALLNWAMADQHAQRRHLLVAAMAITLALAMAVATRVMVGSFEYALVQHLDQRLFADFYLRGSEASLVRWQNQLSQYRDDFELQTLSRREAVLIKSDERTPLQLISHELSPQPWNFVHFKQARDDWYAQLTHGGCIVNEPLALSQNLSLGERLTLQSGQQSFQCHVVAVQYDYGNPAGQLWLARPWLTAQIGAQTLQGLAVTAHQGYEVEQLRARLSELAIPDGAIRPQGALRTIALKLFARTFTITDALATLTLLVAFVSWIASVASASKLWRHDHQILSALGGTPLQLLAARLGQLLALLLAIIITGVLGGQLLGYQLLTLVNPLSFGWTMAVQPLSGAWWPYLLVALFGGLLLALWPLWRELGQSHRQIKQVQRAG